MSMDKSKRNKIGMRIKQAREELKLSRMDIAGFLGCSRSQAGHFETGYSLPSIELLLLFSVKYNVSADWILTGKGKMFASLPVEHDDEVRQLLEGINENVGLKHAVLSFYYEVKERFRIAKKKKGRSGGESSVV